jgi:hypothetical protein
MGYLQTRCASRVSSRSGGVRSPVLSKGKPNTFAAAARWVAGRDENEAISFEGTPHHCDGAVLNRMARFEAAHRRNPGRCKCRQVSWQALLKAMMLA